MPELAGPGRFSGADLSDAHVVGVYWIGPSFGGGTLDRVTIEARLLLQPDFLGVTLRDSTISGHVQEADFRAATLENVTLSGQFLGANFLNAHLAGVDMSAADLEGSTFVGAWFDDLQANQRGFVGVDLTGATFTRASLVGAQFTDLRGVTFRSSDLSQTSLVGATLSVTAETTTFAGANLSTACIALSDFSDGLRVGHAASTPNDLSNASLQGAELLGSDFRGANLTGANLSYTTLTDYWRPGSADPKHTLFQRADLSGADLREVCHLTDVRGAFEGATIEGMRLCARDEADFMWQNAQLQGTPIVEECPPVPAGCSTACSAFVP